jgi:hypothetical protein
VPTPSGGTALTMTAVTAYDPAGVEYYFTCTDGGGNDSGWQNSPTYTDLALTPGVSYSYTVTARDLSPAQNATAPSAAESILLPGQSTVPGVVGMVGSSAESVITTYSFVVGTVTQQSHPTIPAGEVISQNPPGGTSAAVGTSVDLAVSLGDVPLPPTTLSAMAISGSAVTLTWTDASGDETGFDVQRSNSSGIGFVTIGTAPINATSYDDSGLDNGTLYFYRMIAAGSTGDSPASGEASATTWTAAEAWRNQHFGQIENSGDAADGFDFDGDGVANLHERAFGTIPNDPKSENRPTTGMVDIGGSQYLSITYRRLHEGTGTSGIDYTVGGLVYCVEYDNDLVGPWSLGSVTQVGAAIDNGDGTESVTIRLNAPVVGPHTSQFIRLGISQTP